jgi:hypothetical protein
MVVCIISHLVVSLQVVILKIYRNGDHVYQFYQGGLRALNDPNAKHTAQTRIGSWLEPPTEGLNCNNDCCSIILNGDWCNQNCGGPTCRRSIRSEHLALQPRAIERVATVDKCEVSYVLPDYPSSGSASGESEIVKWYDRDDSVNCNNPVIRLFEDKRLGSNYDSKYI